MSTFNHADSSVSNTEETPSGEGSGGIVFLFFLIGLAASLIVGWVIFPKLLYSQKHQPVDFNHALHNELVSEGCESCHFFREDGTFSGAPKLAQCIECHEDVQGESEEEKKFVEEYVKKEIEVPWLIYAGQPDCVFFSHAAHVKTGKMDCVVCHGEMGESTTLRVYESNRITGYSRDIWGHNISGLKRNTWDRMKMDDCSECHQQKKEMLGSVQTQKEGCFVCHK
ncbi:MAG: menaquinone reductase multiheme cytochrome c subunit QrcA [Desulfatirhabdiaceae bacterium]